jgi:glycosyltransferase involved in cell wall biosynthesis
MRILMASDFYSPFIGGAERQMQLLGQELILAGHEVDMATVWHAGLAEQQDERGLHVHRLKGLLTAVPWFSTDPGRRFHPPFPEPGVTWGLRRLIAQRQPDVVHASGWIAHSCAAALLGRSTPLVVSVRDPGYICATRALVREGRICAGPAPRKCLSCATQHFGAPKGLAAVSGVAAGHVLLKRKLSATASVSHYVDQTIKRDFLGMRGRAAGKLGLVIADIALPSGSSSSEDRPDDPILAALPDAPFVLFVGALRPAKGLTMLLEAYGQLHAPPPLVLIGTVWPDTPRELPLGTTLLADMPHRSVMAAWRRCLFGVAPSLLPESLAGVVREGMISGKAMIATDVGGTTDMIAHEQTGLLVAPGDTGALAAAMRRLIDDAGLRERLGQAGQVAAAQFTGPTIAGQFEQLYRRLIEDFRD